MAQEKVNKTAELLAGLLGRENIALEGDRITATPVSTRELAGIIRLVGKAEEIFIEPAAYVIGPVSPPATPAVTISLKKMNQISFDPGSRLLFAGPAAFTGDIIKTASAAGLLFRGKDCRHQKPTIGENLASCFNGGAAGFMCGSACLYGLEMVLFNGDITTVEGALLKGLENDALAYLLSGHRESPAIITGIHLKITPLEEEEYHVIAAFQSLEEARLLPPLLKDFGAMIHKVHLLEHAILSSCGKAPEQLFPGAGEYEACVLLILRGAHPELDEALHGIEELCRNNRAAEVLLVSATSQREIITGLLQNN